MSNIGKCIPLNTSCKEIHKRLYIYSWSTVNFQRHSVNLSKERMLAWLQILPDRDTNLITGAHNKSYLIVIITELFLYPWCSIHWWGNNILSRNCLYRSYSIGLHWILRSGLCSHWRLVTRMILIFITVL